MSASFKVNVNGLKNLSKKFGNAAVRAEIENIAREKAVAGLIGQAINDNFDKQGPGWKPTRRGGDILKKTGLLRASVTTPSAEGNIYFVKGTTIEWGTSLEYASIHQNGGTIVPKNAKALFIPLSPKGEKVGPRKKDDRKGVKLKYGKDFVLAKSVTIPARPFLTISAFWLKEIKAYVDGRVREILDKRVK